MKHPLKSKTILVNMGIAAVSALLLNLNVLQGILTPSDYLVAIMAINAVNVLLRAVTSSPVGVK